MLGYILSEGDGAVNLVMADLADRLARRKLRVGGVIQINTDHCDGRPCDMDLMVLPDGAVIRISQDLGPGATGFRLDPGGLETAVGAVAARLAGAEILILHRFGKQEAEGRGFRPVIADALGNGILVILALRPDFLPAFLQFTDGFGERLTADLAALENWSLCQVATAPV